MSEEILTFVKIPIAEIAEWIKSKHSLPKVLTDFRIEEDALILCFSDEPISDKRMILPTLERPKLRKRRAHRKRNRMKTRGWEPVARITNSKGQKCTVYKPFVDALSDSSLTADGRKKLVEKILRSNKNRPSETTIQYFLNNTLEYIQKQQNSTSFKDGAQQ